MFRARAVGLAVRDYQNVILVKENGLRFHSETAGQRDYDYLAAALAWTGDPKKMNGGGPIWAVFDSRRGRAREVAGQAALRRSRGLLLQRRHDRGVGEEDRQRIPVAADAAGGAPRHGGALQRVRRRRRRSGLQEAEAAAQDRQAAVLRRVAYAVHPRHLYRHPHQHQGAGRRPARQGRSPGSMPAAIPPAVSVSTASAGRQPSAASQGSTRPGRRRSSDPLRRRGRGRGTPRGCSIPLWIVLRNLPLLPVESDSPTPSMEGCHGEEGKEGEEEKG